MVRGGATVLPYKTCLESVVPDATLGSREHINE